MDCHYYLIIIYYHFCSITFGVMGIAIDGWLLLNFTLLTYYLVPYVSYYNDCRVLNRSVVVIICVNVVGECVRYCCRSDSVQNCSCLLPSSGLSRLLSGIPLGMSTKLRLNGVKASFVDVTAVSRCRSSLPLPSSGSTILVRCPAFAATHEWHDERTPSPTLPDHADVTFRHQRWQIDTQFFNQFFLLNSAFLCFACDHHEWLSVDRGGSRLLSGIPL